MEGDNVVKVSETNSFKVLCNGIHYKIADRKLLPKNEQDKLGNEFFLNLFTEADITPGNPKDFFKNVINTEDEIEKWVGDWKNILGVFHTHYILYITLCSSLGVKMGEAK